LKEYQNPPRLAFRAGRRISPPHALAPPPLSVNPPSFIEPCLPTITTGVGWAYEIKHDGFRFICRRDGDRVRVFSRGGHDWTDRVPAIVEAMQALRAAPLLTRW
jgi:ATP-dependent DNA ligase